jgi:hypothetical protein
MTVAKLMQTRAAISAEIDAIPFDVSIDEVFQRKWTIEQEILKRKAVTLDDRDAQLEILAERGKILDVSDELAALVVA